MTQKKRGDLVRLLLAVKGVGQRTAEAIEDAFDSDLDALLAAGTDQLESVPGVGTTTARAIRRRLRYVAEHGAHKQVDSLTHQDKRKNIPTDQLSQLIDLTGNGEPDFALYPRNPELDPQLVWRGKDALDSEDLPVPVVPVYVQDKIVPQAIVENLRDTASEDGEEPELTLFDDFDGLPDDAVFDFYEYDASWSNRMILGDALVVMTSLAEKENLKGEVQTIYIDPPYGIKFQSNWQVSTRDNSVTDGRDISRQPEQVRAFRDTWKDGIHSYLTYLRDRIQVAHTLLSETGSIFVQIGDENLHLVRSLLDEVFGPDNFMSVITVTKTTGAASKHLANVADFVIWYARDKSRVKYRELYKPKVFGGEGASRYNFLLFPDGQIRKATKAELAGVEELPEGARVFTDGDLTNQRPARGKDLVEYEFEGETFTPGGGKWKTTKEGMDRLTAAGRIFRTTGNTLRYIHFLDDFGGIALHNVWTDIGGIQSRLDPKVYVVQTATKIVERCVLMTSDPGDLVLDPTCGSGTTAYVAETWGRRWITVDTSRVALALARARLMGARYPYWLLADTTEGAKAEAEELGRPPVEPSGGYGGDVRRGFVYRRALHVTLGTIANCEEIAAGMSREDAEAAIRRCAESEVLYDQPVEDKHRIRVAGRFTVESLSPHRTLSPTLSVSEGGHGIPDLVAAERPGSYSERDFTRTILENLAKAGVQNGYQGERLEFESLDPYPDGGWIGATGTFTDAEGARRLVAVSVGPEHGTVGREQVTQAAREAVRIGADLVLVCGFAFDGGATDEAADASSRSFPIVGQRNMGRVRVLNVRVNADLMMDEELKATGSGNLFMVFGEPDIDVETTENDEVLITLKGVDVYDPVSNEVRSSGTDDVMAWFIDTEYDENQFFVRHAYFTGDIEQYDPYAQLRRALNTDIDHEAWGRLHSTQSLPFARPSTGKVAVKVINQFGDEVLKVFSV